MSARKSNFKSVSLVGRVSLTWLVVAVLSLAATSDAIAQGKSKKEKVPPGSPFQALQRQIDELRGQLDEGEFEGLRVFNPDPDQPSTLFFGPTDFCNIGIDPVGGLTGMIERDPNGFRLLGRNDQGCRLLFGPTDLCTVEVDPSGPAGLLLRDPSGIRVLNPDEPQAARLFWGPTDECSIGLDPQLTGLVERDPVGFRLLGPDGQGCRLIFGPTLDCTVEVDPGGPPGLLLRDPSGIRVLNPDEPQAARLFWGPTDECSIGLDPQLTGLVERDPVGFRLLGPDGQGCRLIFGPTLDCTVEVDPGGPPGLLLRDPSGIRILNPLNDELPNPPLPGLPPLPATLYWGRNDDCRIESGLGRGMIVYEPSGVVIRSPLPGAPSILSFGEENDEGVQECRIEAGGLGMIFVDPRGFDFGGVVTADGFVERSSRRLKENIRPINDARDKIRRLQGVYFDWKPDKGGNADIGFIAEDVNDVLPEVVKHSTDGTIQGVKYSKMVALAIEGLKAQQEQVDRLQIENDSLRKNLASMQAQMDDLSATVQHVVNIAAE